MDRTSRSLADAVLDVFYVPKCALCGFIDAPPICSVCEGEMERLDSEIRFEGRLGSLDGSARLYQYRGRAEQAVTRLKYSRITALAGPMSERLAEFAHRLSLMDYDLFVPVPIHGSRARIRGFNQSELLAESFPADRLKPEALRRIRATAPQASLSPEARLANVKDAFAATGQAAGQYVVLIDDVLTSGMTAQECAKALKAAGAKEVVAIAFAGG